MRQYYELSDISYAIWTAKYLIPFCSGVRPNKFGSNYKLFFPNNRRVSYLQAVITIQSAGISDCLTYLHISWWQSMLAQMFFRWQIRPQTNWAPSSPIPSSSASNNNNSRFYCGAYLCATAAPSFPVKTSQRCAAFHVNDFSGRCLLLSHRVRTIRNPGFVIVLPGKDAAIFIITTSSIRVTGARLRWVTSNNHW